MANKTKIEWTDYSINPVKGLCPVGCPYCSGRRQYNRNLNETFRNKSIRYDETVFENLPKKPSRIFVGSTIDLLHDEVRVHLPKILWHVRQHPEHTFMFLTKVPGNMAEYEWPDNVWVGVSADTKIRFLAAMHYMRSLNARVKFVSFEPLHESMESAQPIHEHLENGDIDWVIIGAETPYSPKTAPRIEWVKEIVDTADAAKIPVFLKDNLHLDISGTDTWALSPRAGHGEFYRQEFPRQGSGSGKG